MIASRTSKVFTVFWPFKHRQNILRVTPTLLLLFILKSYEGLPPSIYLYHMEATFFVFFAIFFCIFRFMGGPSRNLTTFLASGYCDFYFIPFFFYFRLWLYHLLVNLTTLFELLTSFLSSNASRFMAEPSGSEFYIKVKPAANTATHFWFAVSNFLTGAALSRYRSVTCDHPWSILLEGIHLLRPLLLPSGGNYI